MLRFSNPFEDKQSRGGLEKLHRALLIQLSLIVFHEVAAMKGIMTMNHTIASNH